MGPIGCPETSARNYHYSLRNNPGERSSEIFVFLPQWWRKPDSGNGHRQHPMPLMTFLTASGILHAQVWLLIAAIH